MFHSLLLLVVIIVVVVVITVIVAIVVLGADPRAVVLSHIPGLSFFKSLTQDLHG